MMLRRILSYLGPVLVLTMVMFLLYRIDRKVDEFEKPPAQKAPENKVVYQVPSTPPEGLTPVIRIRSYKPKPHRRITTLAEDPPSWTVMSDRLQWWEKKEPYLLAIALIALDKLGSLHVFLGKQILAVRKNCVPGSGWCMNKWLDIREAVDHRLKEFVSPTRRGMTWVAVTMVYSGNLETFHTTVGQQALKLRRCGKKPKCAREVVRALDTYFKKIVNDHGGPLIDRNWNKH